MSVYECTICRFQTSTPNPLDLGSVCGNTERFLHSTFHLWKCPQCQTIHSIDPVDFQDIYVDYPLNKRKLDVYARGTLNNLLKRLKRAGIKRSDSILDYGCGNGLFVQFLQERGYLNVTGYDPYVQGYTALSDNAEFDCIIANDVIEHCADPRVVLNHCIGLLKQGGLLYIGVPDVMGVVMNDLKPHIMRLHQPFHRIIFTQETLKTLGTEARLELIKSYRRSYMDTLIPFANYRFLDEFSKALGHNMDKALDPNSSKIMFHRPILWFYAFFGYFFPSAYEPAVVLRKSQS